MTPPQSDPPPSPPTLPLYAQLPLWSVMHWDNTTREKVLLEAFLLTHDRSACHEWHGVCLVVMV